MNGSVAFSNTVATYSIIIAATTMMAMFRPASSRRRIICFFLAIFVAFVAARVAFAAAACPCAEDEEERLPRVPRRAVAAVTDSPNTPEVVRRRLLRARSLPSLLRLLGPSGVIMVHGNEGSNQCSNEGTASSRAAREVDAGPINRRTEYKIIEWAFRFWSTVLSNIPVRVACFDRPPLPVCVLDQLSTL